MRPTSFLLFSMQVHFMNANTVFLSTAEFSVMQQLTNALQRARRDRVSKTIRLEGFYRPGRIAASRQAEVHQQQKCSSSCANNPALTRTHRRGEKSGNVDQGYDV